MLSKRIKYITILISIFIFLTSLNSVVYAELKTNNQIIKVKDGSISIKYNYNSSKYICVNFKKCGINSIMGIYSIYLEDKKTGSSSLLVKSISDWVGPYMVKAKNGKNLAPLFTGGFHGSKGDGSGNPTARTIRYSLYIDGVKITKNMSGTFKSVRLIVKNNIQGYNTESTKKEILQETVTYTLDGTAININNDITALDDIVIERYYGLQTINTPWKGKIYYKNMDGSVAVISNTNGAISNSGLIETNSNISDYKIYRNSSSKEYIDVWIDRSYGLGNMENVSPKMPAAFTASYCKSYFNLINEKSLNLNKGETVSWRGKYIIKGDN